MDIDSLFSEEELMVRQTVRDFVDDQVIPIIEEANREEKMPMHLIPKMAEMGLFGPTIKEYDLPGLNNVAYGLIMQELERGDSGLRSFASVQSGLVMYPIYSYGSDAQKDRWLPRLRSGEALGCVGPTGPNLGTTTVWTAGVAVVWPRGDDGEIGGYLVERGTPGFSTLDIHGKFSMRASITSELAFADCRIPLAHTLPRV